MTADQFPRRYGLSCFRCGEWFFTSELPGRVRPGGSAGIGCPICSGQLDYRGTVERDGAVVGSGMGAPCDDRCTAALGVKCDCRCGGRNHGTGRLVEIRWVEGRATLALEDGRMAVLAARRLPVLEEVERLAEVLTAELERQYADVLVDSRAGAWLPRDRWERLAEWQHCRGEIHRTRKLRTPAGRLKVLQALAVRLGVDYLPEPTGPAQSGPVAAVSGDQLGLFGVAS